MGLKTDLKNMQDKITTIADEANALHDDLETMIEALADDDDETEEKEDK